MSVRLILFRKRVAPTELMLDWRVRTLADIKTLHEAITAFQRDKSYEFLIAETVGLDGEADIQLQDWGK